MNIIQIAFDCTLNIERIANQLFAVSLNKLKKQSENKAYSAADNMRTDIGKLNFRLKVEQK